MGLTLRHIVSSTVPHLPAEISQYYPFRLKQDAKRCGKAEFTLLCENNITVLDVPSLKYHVQAIDYNNRTIRVVDPGFQKNNCSSTPVNSPTEYGPFPHSSPYYVDSDLSCPIYFLKCSEPVNISTYIDTAACTDTITSSTGTFSSLSQSRTYGYVIIGDMTSGDVEEGCSLEWKAFILISGNYSNYRDIKGTLNSLTYGFEVGYYFPWQSQNCQWSMNYKCFPHTVAGSFHCKYLCSLQLFITYFIHPLLFCL
ncbi:uncharacterized protein LOC126803467 [Argentina anserina]|uniref:uncharacterized protein LOC126803467 n=1 Tax=Argentina anserina TaxID=57926 RepID=UPI0021764B44|nr:uncharacterized protein LOC126803467 [Potentilla anserina]